MEKELVAGAVGTSDHRQRVERTSPTWLNSRLAQLRERPASSGFRSERKLPLALCPSARTSAGTIFAEVVDAGDGVLPRPTNRENHLHHRLVPTGDKKPSVLKGFEHNHCLNKTMVPRKGLRLDPPNYSKNNNLPLHRFRRLYHWTVLLSTLSDRPQLRLSRS